MKTGLKYFVFIVIFLLISPLAAFCQYEKLDSVIRMMDKTRDLKENKIEELKILSNVSGDDYRSLELLEMIFDEYKHYDYDSAVYYLDRIYQLAESLNYEGIKTHSLIILAQINTENGNYEVAELILEELDPEEMNDENYKEYNKVRYLLNLYRRNLTGDASLKAGYQNVAQEGIAEYLDNTDKNTTDYYFMLAEKLKNFDNLSDSSVNFYLKAIEKAAPASELYRNSAYNIAQYYKSKGEKEKYKKWIIKAATSEAQASMKDRTALKELALFIFKEEPEDIKRATDYMLLTSADAIGFNSSGGIKDVTQNLPDILPTYLEEINNKKSDFILAIILLVVLIAILAYFTMYIKQQKSDLSQKKTSLQDKQTEIESLKLQLNKSHDKLDTINRILISNEMRLNEIHLKRENLAKVWMDICEAQVSNIKSYRKNLTSILSGKKEDNLTKNERISKTLPPLQLNDNDIQNFLKRFDYAFLALYPNFTDEINKLLKENCDIQINDPNSLTTELRICALVRLGIKDSSEMANLLFASVQTIYNNRTKLRNKAKDREKFEEQIMSIYPS